MTDSILFEPVKEWAKQLGFGTLAVLFTVHNGEVRAVEEHREGTRRRITVEEARRTYGKVME